MNVGPERRPTTGRSFSVPPRDSARTTRAGSLTVTWRTPGATLTARTLEFSAWAPRGFALPR